jgi:putative mRNA 3-end processing factor
VERLNRDYRDSGVALPPTTYASSVPRGHDWRGALIVAPPSAMGSAWLRRFGASSTGFASGWMRIRGARRRRSVDRGFALSDHVDWPSLLDTIAATGAERVLVTHGYREPVVRWLGEHGLEAHVIASHWEGELDSEGVLPEGEAPE